MARVCAWASLGTASAGRAFRIDVRLDNGAQYTFRYDSMPNWGVGTRVRVVNGQLTSYFQ